MSCALKRSSQAAAEAALRAERWEGAPGVCTAYALARGQHAPRPSAGPACDGHVT